MTHTQNYNLTQWSPADRILRSDFNADNAKLDAALAAERAAREKTDAAVATRGNCQIYNTSYTGDGQYGANHLKTVYFPGRPLFVLVAQAKTGSFLAMAYNGDAVDVGRNSYGTSVTWGANYVSWYSVSSASSQYTMSGALYYVTAFLAVG